MLKNTRLTFKYFNHSIAYFWARDLSLYMKNFLLFLWSWDLSFLVKHFLVLYYLFQGSRSRSQERNRSLTAEYSFAAESPENSSMGSSSPGDTCKFCHNNCGVSFKISINLSLNINL